MTSKKQGAQTKRTGEKSKDEKLQDVIGAVIDGAFDTAKVMAKAGIRGAFVAKGLSDKVENGEAEQAMKDGVKEVETVMKAAARVAKKHFFDFLKEIVPDEDDPDDKKQA